MPEALFPVKPVLLVDYELSCLRAVSMLLERHLGINHLVTCNDSRKTTRLFGEQEYSLLLLDLTMPHRGGEDVLAEAVESHPQMPVIILTGRNEINLAVSCMKRGAFDYFVKTVEDDRLLTAVRHALELAELRRENSRLQEGLFADDLKHPAAFVEIVTRDPEMLRIFQYAEAIAEGSQPVLISGETGTGKELMARAFHRLCAPDEPFVAVNIAGLDDHVFSDTLFGHLKGAFTGAEQSRAGLIEEASGGVLFLDEIGDLESTSQTKLLRLLQEGEYLPLGADRPKHSRARVVAATNLDLAESIEAGRFRRDLYYRLNTHHIRLPALRQRCGDLPLLARYFVTLACEEFDKPLPDLDKDLMRQLAAYGFPGNLRELRSLVYDAVGRMQQGQIQFSLPAAAQVTEVAAPPAKPVGKLLFPDDLPTLQEVSEQLVDEAMARSEGNISQAARWLGISRPALSKRLKQKGESPT